MLAGGAAQQQTRPMAQLVAARCDHLVKEREAVQTIMEQKIKVLVQSIATCPAASCWPASLHGQATSNNPAAQALTKDVAALQRLVNASIAAQKRGQQQLSEMYSPMESGLLYIISRLLCSYEKDSCSHHYLYQSIPRLKLGKGRISNIWTHCFRSALVQPDKKVF